MIWTDRSLRGLVPTAVFHVGYATALMAVSLATFVTLTLVPASAQDQSSDVAQLEQRVEQLEGQLVDLQVVIGTLESLAQSPRRSGATTSSTTSRTGGGDAARISALETQVRALSAQIQQLSRNRTVPRSTNSVAKPRGSIVSGFGSTTVQPSSGSDPISGLLANSAPKPSSGTTNSTAAGPPKAQYDNAYGALLQQDYQAAQSGFEAFLQANPRHGLAGNAQYWLGEVYYVRGKYKAAAGAFLKGYQTYTNSPKAPDSLLKLAMSLDQLGARKDACSSLNAISERFPDAPGHVKNRTQSELRRMRC